MVDAKTHALGHVGTRPARGQIAHRAPAPTPVG
jgi:hypothetical protein